MVFRRAFVKTLQHDVQERAYLRLLGLHIAKSLDDLRVVPGNRLEMLGGNRKGQHGIRINDKWRVCFRWKDGSAHDVEICDYHK